MSYGRCEYVSTDNFRKVVFANETGYILHYICNGDCTTCKGSKFETFGCKGSSKFRTTNTIPAVGKLGFYTASYSPGLNRNECPDGVKTSFGYHPNGVHCIGSSPPTTTIWNDEKNGIEMRTYGDDKCAGTHLTYHYPSGVCFRKPRASWTNMVWKSLQESTMKFARESLERKYNHLA